MANVTITLTVDTDAILADPKDPNLPVNCRLSQLGGESIGDYMVIVPDDSTENVSHLHVGDVITWQGIPTNGNTANPINILSIVKDAGSSTLGPATIGTWTYGQTVTRDVQLASSLDEKETYTIEFNIDGGQTFGLDPKITIHASH